MAQLISALEGIKRPLELVTSDFLVHTVELVMSRFFRAARTEKDSSMDPPNCMNSPAACSTHLKQIITQVIDSQSDHSQRIVDEAHYRAWITKDRANSPEARNKKASKPIQICAAHFGSEFGAMNSPTKKPYKCAYGVKCMFSHIIQKGKSPTVTPTPSIPGIPGSVIVPGPGSRSYRVPTLPDPTGYYYCTLQLGCSIVVAICSVHLEVN